MMTLLLLKGEPAGIPPPARERAGQRSGRVRIRCPRCGWEPGSHDRWMCLCLHVWNTFDTRGLPANRRDATSLPHGLRGRPTRDTHRFPFGVFFFVEGDRATVLAVLHLHRDPSSWERRR